MAGGISLASIFPAGLKRDMEKLDIPQSRRFGPLVIWADELREITRIISQASKMLKIIAEDIRYESIDELLQEVAGGVLKNIEFSASDPYCTISLNDRSASLYVGSSNTESIALFHRVCDVISKCERKPRVAYKVWRIAIFFIILTIVFDICAAGVYQTNMYLEALIGAAMITTCAWYMYIAYLA